MLYRLEQEDVRAYEDICRQIGRVLPGFDRFAIEEEYGKVLLRWKAKWTDKTFGAHLTSDGSLRAFALVTLLRMPAGDVAGRRAIGRAGAGLASVGRGTGREHDRVALPRKANHRGHTVAAVSGQLRISIKFSSWTWKRAGRGAGNLVQDAYGHWLENYSTGELWGERTLSGDARDPVGDCGGGTNRGSLCQGGLVSPPAACWLIRNGVAPTPFLISQRGGNVTVERLALDLANSSWDFDFVTSLVDFYGFRDRGPGEDADALESRIDKAVDRRIGRNWNQSRVFPYVQRHEFEGLLFYGRKRFFTACVKRRT